MIDRNAVKNRENLTETIEKRSDADQRQGSFHRRAIAAATAVALSAQLSFAAEIDPDYATKIYVLAIGLSQACPGWRVDIGTASRLLRLAGVAPEDFEIGGKRHDSFMTTAATVKSNLAKQGQDVSCRDAEGMFGPQGSLFKQLLGQTPERR